MSKTIVFFNHHLDLRGTNTSMYNFAHYNETILGNNSIIMSYKGAEIGNSSYTRFKNRFKTILIDVDDLDSTLNNVTADYFYHQRFGAIDFIPKEVPALIHAAFGINQPHGHKYFYVSDYLARQHGLDPTEHSVPLLVDFPESPTESLRDTLKLNNKTIFGYLGDNFDIPWVKETILEVVNIDKNVVFLFMLTTPFCEHSNIKFVEGTSDPLLKSNFIHTCDAMIDGCSIGQTFGMSIAEFSMCDKPVITWANPPTKAHLDYIGHKAFLYNNSEELMSILLNYRDLSKYPLYSDCYESCSPINAMKRFSKVCFDAAF